MDARFTDEDGEQHPMLMGCYGIGISRVLAAVAEEIHDEPGWRGPPRSRRTTSTSSCCPAAASGRRGARRRRRIYDGCKTRGSSVLYDDRERAPA